MSDLFVERYRVIRQLGAGGMGVVFEAEDQLLNKHVAIKTMKKGVLGAEHIMRFQREATALAALNHPNLVPLYVFGITEDNEPYMVMSVETGVPLCDLIKERRITIKQAVSIFIQICDAMQHAHDRSVLHRGLQCISELKYLKYLGLRDEFAMTDGLRHLENSPSLEYIAMSECKLSADSLEGLGRNNKIQMLYIRECTDTNNNSQGSFLGDDAIEALARGGSKSLTKLSWMRMATPRSGTLRCLKNFPNLKVLKLSWLGLKNSSLKDLLDLNLEILDITSNNEIDAAGLKQLERMKHLKRLRVGENITDRDLREQVPRLKSKIKIVIEPAPAARVTEQQFDLDHF